MVQVRLVSYLHGSCSDKQIYYFPILLRLSYAAVQFIDYKIIY